MSVSNRVEKRISRRLNTNGRRRLIQRERIRRVSYDALYCDVIIETRKWLADGRRTGKFPSAIGKFRNKFPQITAERRPVLLRNVVTPSIHKNVRSRHFTRACITIRIACAQTLKTLSGISPFLYVMTLNDLDLTFKCMDIYLVNSFINAVYAVFL